MKRSRGAPPRSSPRPTAGASPPGPRGGRSGRETVRIESLAAGGDGVARLGSGVVVFVPRTAQGDVVEIEVSDAGKRAEGRVLRVVAPSPDRVEPPCPYLDPCGGCPFMHLTAKAQADAHAAIVRAAIAHALPGVALPEIVTHAAPAPFAYRTRARLFVRVDRRGARVGYRAAGSHEIAAIDRCLGRDPAIAPLIDALAEVLAAARGEGDAAVGRGHGGLPVVSLEWRGELATSTWAALDARVTMGGPRGWAGARVHLEGAGRPAVFGDPRPVLAGVDGAPLLIAPGGFAQPSDEGAAVLARRVDELARIEPPGAPRPRHVVELFAGSGTLSVLLARDAVSFTAIEVDPEACDAARENHGARHLAGRVLTADADHLEVPVRSAHVVVLDPPRGGAALASAAIAASRARVVVYVACEPSTLARDLPALTAGRLAITHVETFELFPQTSHVETVVRLERAR